MDEAPNRVLLTENDFINLNNEIFAEKWKLQNRYIDYLEAKLDSLKQDSEKRLKDLEENKSLEIVKLKNLLLMKYMIKDQEQTNQLQEMQNIMSTTKARQTFIDPSINLVLVQMKKELDEVRKQKDEALSELNAWKFTSESQIGKRLIAKCRKLIQENEELGKIISSGNIANLEADIAYHKRLLADAYENEKNLHGFINEMDTEMDAMQSTIMQLQQKLNSYKQSSKNDKKS